MIVEMTRSDGITSPIMSPGNPVKLSRMPEDSPQRVPWVGEIPMRSCVRSLTSQMMSSHC